MVIGESGGELCAGGGSVRWAMHDPAAANAATSGIKLARRNILPPLLGTSLADYRQRNRSWGATCGGAVRRLFVGGWTLVRRLHAGAGFVDGALRVVVGLDGEAVLVHGALTLA